MNPYVLLGQRTQALSQYKGNSNGDTKQNSLATKIYVQHGLAPKLSLQNGLATRLSLQHSQQANSAYKTAWQPSSACKTIEGLCTPFLYYKMGYKPEMDVRQIARLPTVWQPGSRYKKNVSANQILRTKRFRTQALCTKRFGNQALVTTQLASKFYL